MRKVEAQDAAEVEEHSKQPSALRRILLSLLRILILVAFVLACAWFWWLFLEIRHAASQDRAAPADAIAVFGAAEYNGRPSPVLNARLEHALELYQRGLAPVIITLGGGSDPQYGSQYSEGEVGRDFLLSHGVPDGRIIAETTSSNTEESAVRLAAIARGNHWQTILAVSDGTHLFRIQQLCAAQGLHVLPSPRENGKSVGKVEMLERYAHEMIGYTLWRIHLH